jgi:hypothetical protein
MDPNTQLLCTFSSQLGYLKDIESVQVSYTVLNDVIFVLQSLNDPNEVFLTYNVVKQSTVRRHKTIIVHRKKNANVIYSINALNKLLGEDAKGQPVDWTKYRNSIIIICDGELKIIPTKLLAIYRLK